MSDTQSPAETKSEGTDILPQASASNSPPAAASAETAVAAPAALPSTSFEQGVSGVKEEVEKENPVPQPLEGQTGAELSKSGNSFEEGTTGIRAQLEENEPKLGQPKATGTEAASPKSGDAIGNRWSGNETSVGRDVGGDVNLTSHADHSVHHTTNNYGESAEVVVVDPTGEFPKIAAIRLRETEEVVQKWRQMLKEHRVLLVSCEEESILPHAASKLIHHSDSDWSGFEPLLWAEDPKKGVAIRLHHFVERRVKIGKGKAAIIFGLLARTSRFLNNLADLNFDLVKSLLATKDFALILRLPPLSRGMEEGAANWRALKLFPHWRLDALKYTLDCYFSAEEADVLCAKIKRQAAAGKWGHAPLKEAALKQAIDAVLGVGSSVEESAAALRRAVEGFETDDFRRTVAVRVEMELSEGETSHSTDSNAPSRELPLAERDPLSKAVLFVGAFFPGLSLQEFDRALCTVIAEEVIESVEEEEERFPGATPGEPPRLVTKKVTKEKKLISLWRRNEDACLRKCSLRSVRRASGERAIEFSKPLRFALQDEFEKDETFYTFRLRRLVISSGWFFEEDLSEQVLENLLTLATSATSAAPVAYGKELLMGMVRGLVEHLAETEREKDAKLAQQLAERVEQGFESAEEFASLFEVVFEDTEFWSNVFAKRKRHIYLRLSQLCQRMVEESAQAKAVVEFFDELLRCEQYDAVIGIGERLRGAPNFDFMDWLRRILNLGSPARWDSSKRKSWLGEAAAKRALMARALVQRWLDRELSQGDLPALELLEAIRSWLPPAEREIAHYSMSDCYALVFLQRFAEKVDRTSEAWKKEQFGVPVSNPLLARWLGGKDNPISPMAEREMKMLASWLTHPGLPFAARIHWLEHFIGSIQREQPHRRDVLRDLRQAFGSVELPGDDDVEDWERELQMMAAEAEDNDFATFPISDFLARWTGMALPLVGEASAESLQCWQNLLREVAAGLRKRRALAQRIERTWSAWIDMLLQRVSELPVTREFRAERNRGRALRTQLTRLRRQFQIARAAAA